MKVSLSWLGDYVPLTMEPDRLATALTMIGLEVEAVTDRYAYLDTVLVGRITEIAPHPKADKLQICRVETGERGFSVVCGAPNAQAGMLAPLALPGSLLPDGTHLAKNVLRGIVSEGMLCSALELGLGSDGSGLMPLAAELVPGEKLSRALGLADPVFEIGLTPNRPDCLSIIGIAREVAAIQKTTVTYPDFDLRDVEDSIAALTSVKILNPEHCPRYCARLIEGITVAASPYWIQDRLWSVGLRPINNIVDITNFVMLETGQPLHAFDFDRLAQNRIVVRTAATGETFATLDEKIRELSPEMLMICDGEKPVAIGGVMGGLNSEIDPGTTRVLIESAYFNPVSIRKTSKKLGLSTEAAYRFERGVDPDGTVRALNRAACLMAGITEGSLVPGLIDAHPRPAPPRKIRLGVAATNQLLGTTLGADRIRQLLQAVEFEVVNHPADHLTVVPPTYRVDVERPVDLMEEVARLEGYAQISTTLPVMPTEAGPSAKPWEVRNRIKTLMTGLGFTEAINYSFIHKLSCDRLGLEPDDRRRDVIDILNPLGEDQAVMRTSLIPGLLETMRRNIVQQVKNIRIFEAGKVFLNQGPERLPEEREMLAGLWTGARSDVSWHAREAACDFYDLKGVVEGLLGTLKVEPAAFTATDPGQCRFTRSGHTAQIAAAETVIGLIGEIHPQTLGRYDLKQPAFVFEIDLQLLAEQIPEKPEVKVLSRFPAVARDVTLIVPAELEAIAVLNRVSALDETLVEDLFLFDVFAGAPIPPGKKSISFRVTYRSEIETLEDDRVNRVHQTITANLLKEFDATLPA